VSRPSVLPAVGLLEACDDPRLFGFPLWPKQRELLAAVEPGPRVHVWALGRRSGKTTLAALVALWDCLLRPELAGKVRPGERRYAVAVATNLRQARLFVRGALSVIERSPLLRDLLETQTEDELLFRNGAAIAAFPCSSRGGRGWPVSTLLMDEAAHFISDTDGPMVAERVFGSLAPATAQFGDAARIIVASTPYGSDGFFADLFQRAQNGELEDSVAHHAPSAEMNPTIAPDFLVAEEARDSEVFKSEYQAQFVGGGNAFLDPEDIADAVGDRAELSPEHAVGWVAGLDPAFSSDPFGLALVGRDPDDRGRLVLGLARAWKPSRRGAVSFEERRSIEDTVLTDVAGVCREYRAEVLTDQYAAPAIVDALRRHGLAVRTVPMTAASKTEVFLELRARLASHALELYEEPALLSELRRLRSKFSAGSSAVVNPRVGGSHGDLAQALALAVWGHRGGAPGGELPRHGFYDGIRGFPDRRQPGDNASIWSKQF
jgi:Terminase large subunit, T4likevirus-type, N-terminal